jgi:hypothetical protein
MATVDETLNLARSFLGEGPKRFTDWYPASPTTPWCAIFQSYVLTATGQPLHYAWVSGMFDAYRAQGRNSYDVRSAQPGDLVAFEYGENNGGYDHIAMVESVLIDGSGLVCINGNWQNRVQRVLHRFDRSGFAGGIKEIARPFYTSPTPTPTPDEDEMKSVLLLDRTYNPGRVYHACGNTMVALTDWSQVQFLQFLGVQLIDPAPPEWLKSLATLPRNEGVI